MFPKKAIILAGGLGTRLRPLTYQIPKALIPVGKKNLTEHILDLLKRHGVKEVVLSVGYMADQIKDHFRDGSNHGLKITYAVEEERMGTAGPLMLLNKFQETFLMLNGDNLFNLDFDYMYKMHQEEKATATIALTPTNDSTRGGVTKMQGHKILEFLEKPSPELALKEIGLPPYWLSSGYYILEPAVFDLVKGKNFAMMETDIFPILAKKGKLVGYKDEGYWADTGTWERYDQVKRDWKSVF